MIEVYQSAPKCTKVHRHVDATHVWGTFCLLYRKFLLNHELCKQIALQKQGTENRRLRLEDIKTFFSKIVIVDIIKFM